MGTASSASEARRLKRIEQKLSETTCFACREKGHPARDCPKANQGGEDQVGRHKTSVSIGLCYRSIFFFSFYFMPNLIP